MAEQASRSSDELWQGLIAGAVIGDFVKGGVPDTWPVPLQVGVRLHRKIDALSNRSSGMRVTSQRYPAELRRFAPIFVDMLADHCLALDWSQHHKTPIADFSALCYEAIARYEEYLGATGQRFFAYMCEQDLLAHYDQWPHIRRGLASVLRRLKRETLMSDVETTSLMILGDAQQDFASYYPELRQMLTRLDLDDLRAP